MKFLKRKIFIGDLIEVVKQDENFPHDLTIGYQYYVKYVYLNEPKYLINDYDFSTGCYFEQALYEDEIKLIRRSWKNGKKKRFNIFRFLWVIFKIIIFNKRR